jgi:DNA polymerase-3 subunit alpha (Gram-positive type)
MVIDTLPLARMLLPELRYHNLKALAKFYKVEYDKDSAHRADYDAEQLAKL